MIRKDSAGNSFVADNYAPFYSRPIEWTDRDAPFVLDGVLYHESYLDLEEHDTDTPGYTEINGPGPGTSFWGGYCWID